MADDIRRDERDDSLSSVREEPGRTPGSPLGTDPQEAEPLPGDPREAQEPQEAEPLPGDPREAQEPQEPGSTHIGTPGRETSPFHEETSRPIETQVPGSGLGESGAEDGEEERGAVDQLREAWDRMRGKGSGAED